MCTVEFLKQRTRSNRLKKKGKKERKKERNKEGRRPHHEK